MAGDLFIGVVAGIVASVICVFASLVWRNALYPKFLESFYETIRLHQRWESQLDFKDGVLHNIQVSLDKRGKWVTGAILFTAGPHQGKSFPLKGYFKSSILTFTYEAAERKSTSQGAGTFERLQDGRLLSGYFAYYSPEKQKVDVVDCDLQAIVTF